MTDKYTRKDIEHTSYGCGYCFQSEEDTKLILHLMNRAYEEGKKEFLNASNEGVDIAIECAYQGGYKQGKTDLSNELLNANTAEALKIKSTIPIFIEIDRLKKENEELAKLYQDLGQKHVEEVENLVRQIKEAEQIADSWFKNCAEYAVVKRNREELKRENEDINSQLSLSLKTIEVHEKEIGDLKMMLDDYKLKIESFSEQKEYFDRIVRENEGAKKANRNLHDALFILKGEIKIIANQLDNLSTWEDE